ncbi:MAG: hypothetical protein ACOZBL_05280 [Patescibacteria group bacterium]
MRLIATFQISASLASPAFDLTCQVSKPASSKPAIIKYLISKFNIYTQKSF